MSDLLPNNIIVSPEVKEYVTVANKIAKSNGFRKLYDLLGVKPTPMQDKVITLFDDKLQHFNILTLVASRRAGKSFTAATLVVRELLIPHSSTLLVSTSSKSVSNLFNEVVRLLKLLGITPDSINANQYYIKVKSGTFRAAFTRSVDGLLGNKATLIILDENGTYDYHNFLDQILLPMRLDYKTYIQTGMFVAKTVFISSPRAIGSDLYIDYNKGLPSLKDRYKHNKNDLYISKDGYVSLHYSIYDSPLVTPDIIQSIKDSNTDEVFKTEYEAKFIPASSGSVYDFNDLNIYDFNKFISKFKDYDIGTLQGFIGVDIGLKDKSAIVVGTVIENKLYILEVYANSMLTSLDIARQIKQLIDKWSHYMPIKLDFDEGAIYIDPSAALTRYDLANTYDIPNLPAFNKIKEGVDYINILFKNKQIMLPDTEDELIIQLQELAYKESNLLSVTSGHNDPFEKRKGHHFDIAHAFRYLVASVYRYWGLPEVHYDYDGFNYKVN